MKTNKRKGNLAWVIQVHKYVYCRYIPVMFCMYDNNSVSHTLKYIM